MGAPARPLRFTPRLQKPLSLERSGGRSRSAFFLHPNSLNFLFLWCFLCVSSKPQILGGSRQCLAPPALSPKQHLCNSGLSIPQKATSSPFSSPKVFLGTPQTLPTSSCPSLSSDPPGSVGDRRTRALPDEFPEATEPLVERNRAQSGARCSLINRLLITNEISPLQYL